MPAGCKLLLALGWLGSSSAAVAVVAARCCCWRGLSSSVTRKVRFVSQTISVGRLTCRPSCRPTRPQTVPLLHRPKGVALARAWPVRLAEGYGRGDSSQSSGSSSEGIEISGLPQGKERGATVRGGIRFEAVPHQQQLVSVGVTPAFFSLQKIGRRVRGLT